ncbi:MAG: rod-binding protein [Treponema sp.]|nr:rod-binding protein [Treponema sp.]
MNVSAISTYSGLTNGASAVQAATQNADKAKFSELLDKLRSANASNEPNPDNATLSSSQIAAKGRLNGEYTTGFAGVYTSDSDKVSTPRGAAANQANPNVKAKTIDRTSDIYQKALELENYFVKQMLSEMRKSINKAQDGDFATKMYEDMLWDEYSEAMTKNAGFGLADQIYSQLA